MPNLISKARQGRIAAIAQLGDRKTPRSFDADRLFQANSAMMETGRRPAPLNIFA